MAQRRSDLQKGHVMGRMSRNKGKVGEREIAHILQERGYDAHRGQQFCGANGDADVVGLPGVHIEVKRTESLSLYAALEQSTNDAREGEIPVVFHRKNHQKWVAIMELDNFLNMYEEARNAND